MISVLSIDQFLIDLILHYVRFMWFTALVLVLVINISEVDLLIGISDLVKSLHLQCLKFTPASLYHHTYSALVCGSNLRGGEFQQNLKNLGIYHMMIISGSHLVFISMIIELFFNLPIFAKENLKGFKAAAFTLIIIYSLATGFEAPVVRALLGMGLNSLQQRKKLFWSQNEVIFISVLVCLAFFAPWRNSYSLLLSFVASISLNLCSRNGSLLKNIKIYFLILPFLLPLAAPGFFSILSNMVLSPIIGFVLFPLSFLSYVIPYFYFAVDPLWKYFLYICNLIGPEMQTWEKLVIAMPLMWVMALIMNFYGIFKDKESNK